VHPLIQKLAGTINSLAPPEPVDVLGEWSIAHRKTYKDSSQAGSGMGPFVEVVDYRWRGTLECASPLAGIGFLVTQNAAFWVKSPPAILSPIVEVSIHAWAGEHPGRATFAANMLGSFLPGVPFAYGDDPTTACSLRTETWTTGHAHEIAAVKEAAFVLVLLPTSLLKVGRNRLWHFREAYQSALPSELQVFVRGRTGTLRS